MCLIIGKSKGVALPKADILKNGQERNSDGIGIAYWKYGSNEVTIKKDFETVGRLIRWLPKHVEKKDALIIHFRSASSGLVDKGNRHPFPLTKNWKLLRKTNLKCKIVVAHNGIISQYGPRYYAHPQKYSDTQKFIMDILSDDQIKNNLSRKAVKKLLKNYIGNDRLCFLNSRGTMTTLGEFEKDKGLVYSNASYKKIRPYSSRFLGNEEKISLRDDIYLNDRLSSTVDRVYEREFGIIVQEPYMGQCDLCLKKTALTDIYDYTNQQNYGVCKECRKKRFANGCLKPQKSNSKEQTQCGSCLDWYKRKELTKYGDLYLCKTCEIINRHQGV